MFSLLLAWTNSWANSQVVGDRRRHEAHAMSNFAWYQVLGLSIGNAHTFLGHNDILLIFPHITLNIHMVDLYGSISLLSAKWLYIRPIGHLNKNCIRLSFCRCCCSQLLVECIHNDSWCRHQLVTFSALLAFCEGKPPLTGGFPSQRPVARSFGIFFDLRLKKRFSNQSSRR